MLAAPEAVSDSQPKDSRLKDPLPSQPSQPNSVAAGKFGAAQRLLRADGFNRVIRAESIADKDHKIFFMRNGLSNARLGIVASKKSIPHAAGRNRSKRMIRETFRQHAIKILPLDLVVMVKSASTQMLGVQTQGTRSDSLKALFCRVEKRCAES